MAITTTPCRFRSQAGYSWIELLITVVFIFGIGAALAVWRYNSGLGPVFLHPGTAEAARSLIQASLTDVEKVGEPVITGDRTVTLSATIAKKDCKVELYSPKELENDYGWKIRKVDCPRSPLA